MNTVPSSTACPGVRVCQYVDHHQAPGQPQAQQVDGEPLAFVDHDRAACSGAETAAMRRPQQLARGGLQPQADHRAGVADEVEQRGGVAAVRIVLGAGKPHQCAVEAQDDEGDHHVAGRPRSRRWCATASVSATSGPTKLTMF